MPGPKDKDVAQMEQVLKRAETKARNLLAEYNAIIPNYRRRAEDVLETRRQLNEMRSRNASRISIRAEEAVLRTRERLQQSSIELMIRKKEEYDAAEYDRKNAQAQFDYHQNLSRQQQQQQRPVAQDQPRDRSRETARPVTEMDRKVQEKRRLAAEEVRSRTREAEQIASTNPRTNEHEYDRRRKAEEEWRYRARRRSAQSDAGHMPRTNEKKKQTDDPRTEDHKAQNRAKEQERAPPLKEKDDSAAAAANIPPHPPAHQSLPLTVRPNPNPNPTPNLPTPYQAWTLDLQTAFQNPSALTTFPSPPYPSEACRKASCIANRPARALKICGCDIEKAIRATGRTLKEERKFWHPDRFAKCRGDLRGEFERKAKEVFLVVGEMYEAEVQRGR